MIGQLPITSSDLLDAMMRAAFTPRSEFVGMASDYNGALQPQYATTPSLIDPLVQAIRKHVEDDEEFRALLIQAITDRMDTIVDGIVRKIAGENSSFGIATESGYNAGRTTYKLADWLKVPLGNALAEALTPALVEHFSEEGVVNFGDAKINITVEVVR